MKTYNLEYWNAGNKMETVITDKPFPLIRERVNHLKRNGYRTGYFIARCCQNKYEAKRIEITYNTLLKTN